MDLKEMGAYLMTPTPRDLLRVEALDWYDSAADDPHFKRWTEGKATQVDEGWQGWLDGIAAATADGGTRRRVHVIAEGQPLNGYLQFEFGEQYVRNAGAGEQIRIREVGAAQLAGREYTDFWVADERVAIMKYGKGGRFVRAEAAGRDAGYWALHAAHLWAEATPFEQWWASYQRKAA